VRQVGNRNRLSKLSKSGSTSNLFSHFKSLRHRQCACVRACVGVCVCVCVCVWPAGGGGGDKGGGGGGGGGGIFLQLIKNIE